MLIVLKCPSCFQEIASGPANAATASFLLTVEHVCPMALALAQAQTAGAATAGALTVEEIERLSAGGSIER